MYFPKRFSANGAKRNYNNGVELYMPPPTHSVYHISDRIEIFYSVVTSVFWNISTRGRTEIISSAPLQPGLAM